MTEGEAYLVCDHSTRHLVKDYFPVFRFKFFGRLSNFRPSIEQYLDFKSQSGEYFFFFFCSGFCYFVYSREFEQAVLYITVYQND